MASATPDPASGRPLTRIAIANRGEAAMRFIHAVRDFNAEHGTAIRTVALHAEGERHAMFAREADEAVGIRPAGSGAPYLDHAALAAAMTAAHVDAVWPGWGFVAEDPAFVEVCDALGVAFIGPSADVMRRLGHKIEAKLIAEQAGIPVAPWSNGPVTTVESARAHAETIGFPLMIKASAGGGGRGIRMVGGAAELEDAFDRARSEAAKSFGDDTVFMEKLLTDVRHVEVQIIADEYGTVWTPGVRDCSVQRRNQKVVEESASTALTPDHERILRESAVALARATGYRNAGTVEFLFQPATGTLAFLEVNPRLQVEHPVTEVTSGIDLVKLQLHVAMGGRLPDAPPPARGHAIEVRLNAEDPDRGFSPAPGSVEVLQLPCGPGIRVDTGIAEGDVIPPDFDSMVAKIIAWGSTRDEARARIERALGETTVLIRDGTTNKAFLLDILARPELRTGTVDTGWLDRLTAEPAPPSRGPEAVALVVAALEAAHRAEEVRRAGFFALASRGRPELAGATGETVELRHQGHVYRAEVLHVGPAHYHVRVDGVTVEATVHRLTPWERRVEIGGARHRATVQRQGTEELIEVDGTSFRFSRDDGGLVRAPAAGVVVVVHATPGAVVAAGEPLLVLEAMKMEVAITAPVAGRVRAVLATPNVQVAGGTPLVRLEPVDAGDDGNGRAASRVVLTELQSRPSDADPTQRCLAYLETLRCSLLGFELPPGDVRRVIVAYRNLRSLTGDGDPDLVRAEMALLTVFADLSVLWRNRSGEPDGDEQTSGPSEYLNTYLRSLDADREGLPPAFRARLRRALEHYDVTELRRSPPLEEALFWIFHAQRRAPVQLQAVLALLDQRVDAAPVLAGPVAEEFRDTLDRLIVATQLRYPVIGDLARNIRYRWFDRPVIIRAADAVLGDLRAHLARLDAAPDAPTHDDDIEVLVNCAQPVLSLLAGRPPRGDRIEPMVEVLTRRYYKIRPVTDVRAGIVEGRNVVTARYQRGDRIVHVIAAHISAGDLERAVDSISAMSRRIAPGETAVVDLYVAVTDEDPTGVTPGVVDLLDRRPPAAAVTRVTLTLLSPGGAQAHATLRPNPAGGGHRFTEDAVMRGLHPMIARRLHLWRLANFVTERLPAPPDAYLFHCTAPDNSKDERFIAVAEVRDLTPVRDADGGVAALPELEHVLAACLEALRRAQTDRPPDRRPSWNRVLLHVWPESEVPLDELLPIAGRIVPLTVGLGLEAVHVQGRFAVTAGEPVAERVLRLAYQPGTGLTVQITDPPTAPMQPLDAYTQKVIEARRRGTVFPHELFPLLTGGGAGTFVEHDLDDEGRLVPVDRPPGSNRAGVVVGVVSMPTVRYPEGMTRVALFGDPTRALGSIAEPECRRVLGAIDLAEQLDAPIEWFALSAGAKIAMDSGTENLDWVARVLRRIIGFTQAGGEINVVVAGINVGAQPYWNAEATMLMHTRGILVMTPHSAMVLTGKQALEYSGGVSAEDNAGIGGYERIMGPNGQAQYWAPDLSSACEILLNHYEYAYRAPGEPAPRRAVTSDPTDRDVSAFPHVVDGSDFTRVGDIFSEATNPGRKKPFDMRTLMRATLDQDRQPLERWAQMGEADTVIVFDGHLGGFPVSMLGVESRPLPRFGALPADGPDQWSAGTLFPLSSKKMARAINAASGSRPVVILANLSGFDGSPESLRRLQLEYGAEIGRAVVNFDGPIVFCVVSRYHGGAFVVFSATLNDRMQVLAVEGSHASVIGGAPAAAVVFTGDVTARVRADARIVELERRISETPEGHQAELRSELAQLREVVRLEKLGEVANEFDAIHTVQRAQQVGSVHKIISPAALRPALVAAVADGLGTGSRAGSASP